MINFTKFKDTGDLLLPKNIKDFLELYLIGSDKSIFYITIWSIIHFISGCAFALLFIFTETGLSYTKIQSFWIAFGVHLLWELWQILITNTPRTIRGLVDTIVDTILFMLGFIFIIQYKPNKLQRYSYIK
jgi:hypothetical protein